MSAQRPMRFVTMDSGCMVCISHAIRKNGYLNKKWGWAEESIAEPFHRFIYRAHNGEHSIPEGWEIDHVCNNRACCNPRHLRALSRKDHLDLTNRIRPLERMEQGRLAWEAHGKNIGPSALARYIDEPQTTVSRWIKRWQAEDRELALAA